MHCTRVCVAGATGWAGSELVRELCSSEEFELTGAVARKGAGQDIGDLLGIPRAGVPVCSTLTDALRRETDVVVEYTSAESVLANVEAALRAGVRVVIGSSGLTAADFARIQALALDRGLGVVAAGNFSITAALAKRFTLEAAKYLSSCEIIDYAHAGKIDAPSGTTREIADELEQRAGAGAVPADRIPIHSVRLPSYTLAFETIFGASDERLTVRHDAGAGAKPYVAGALLAIRSVMRTTGLVRGLDSLLFPA